MAKTSKILFFLVSVICIFIYAFLERKNRKEENVSFRSSWNSYFEGTIDSLIPISNNTGIVLLTIDTFPGNNKIYNRNNYKGGSFYLLCHLGKAKLVESRISKMKIGDKIAINRADKIAVIRNGKIIFSEEIYFDDFQLFWSLVNTDMIKNDWAW